jgi:hypothetical protein
MKQSTRAYQRSGCHPHKGRRRRELRAVCKEYHTHRQELEIVMPKILEGVKEDDEMVGGVDTMKYFDHDMADTVKFPDLAQHNYMESRGEGPSGAPLLEPA